MKHILAILIALALAAPFATANPGDDHRREPPTEPGPGDGFTMPDAAIFGLCVAWQANETGRENGNAGNAAPFAWLADQAEAEDQTVEEYCADRAPGSPP